MARWKIVACSYSKQIEAQGDRPALDVYTLVAQEDGTEGPAVVGELLQRPGTEPLQPGAVAELEKRDTDYGVRFKKPRQQAGGGGFRGETPEQRAERLHLDAIRQARITRQHSQDMALRAIEVGAVRVPSEIHDPIQWLLELTDRFHDDAMAVTVAPPKPAPAPTPAPSGPPQGPPAQPPTAPPSAPEGSSEDDSIPFDRVQHLRELVRAVLQAYPGPPEMAHSDVERMARMVMTASGVAVPPGMPVNDALPMLTTQQANEVEAKLKAAAADGDAAP